MTCNGKFRPRTRYYPMATKKPTTSTLRKTPTGDTGSPCPLCSPWLVVALGLPLYVNTLFHDYALDDAIVITENMFTQQGISGIPGLAKVRYLLRLFKEEGTYNPWPGAIPTPDSITFAIEQYLFGGSPFMSHLDQCFVVRGLCALLFFTMRGCCCVNGWTGCGSLDRPGGGRPVRCPPPHTEAVANIQGP